MESTINARGSNDYAPAHIAKGRLCEEGKPPFSSKCDQNPFYHIQNFPSANES